MSAVLPARLRNAALITTCKGRLADLQQSLPSWLAMEQPLPLRVVVVDYGDPEESGQWVARLGNPQVTAIRALPATDEFQRSLAKNIGAVRACADVLLFVDADVQLRRAWYTTVLRVLSAGHSHACADQFIQDIGGTCAVVANAYHQIRGYDERLTGWGYEDMDIYNRLTHAFQRPGTYPHALADPQQHSDALRLRWHADKQRDESYQRNAQLAGDLARPVNATGYGVGTILR